MYHRQRISIACYKDHAKINRKMENVTPCKIVTPEGFILKLGTCDYVWDANIDRH